MSTTELAVPEQSGVMQLLSVAVSSGAAPESVRELVQILREERAHNAEMEFNAAMHRAQERMKRIGVDAMNPQTHSKYASYAKLDSALRPIYTGEGFSLSFDTGESSPDVLLVRCYVSHVGGHTRRYQYPMPIVTAGPQGKAVMTPTHAAGSAGSYGMRYLLKMIFNVAVGETDDDGNGGQPGEGLDEKTFALWDERIRGARTVKELQDSFFGALEAAKKAGDQNAVTSFQRAKNETWRQNGGFK